MMPADDLVDRAQLIADGIDAVPQNSRELFLTKSLLLACECLPIDRVARLLMEAQEDI